MLSLSLSMITSQHIQYQNKNPLKSECDCLYGWVFENGHTRNLPSFGVT